MHKTMSVSDRIQSALAGYCLLDLWKILSDREARKRGVPVGSLWLAPQTRKNLQSSAIGLISALLSKDKTGNPFCHGHARWTQLHLEQWFGRLRMRQHDAKFTAKQYWKASATEMIRVNKLQNVSADTSVMEPPSDTEFYDASERAFKAAVKLAAWCGQVTEESLEALYRQSGASLISAADASEDMHEWERDADAHDLDQPDADPDAELNAHARWNELLNQVRDDAATASAMDDADAGGNGPQNDADAMEEPDDSPQKPAEPDPTEALLQMADGSDLRTLCTGDGGDEAVDAKIMFTNLHDALAACADQSSAEWFDKLWRLVMYLRFWRQGCDHHLISNPRSCRRKASNMHWYRPPGSKDFADTCRSYLFIKYLQIIPNIIKFLQYFSMILEFLAITKLT